MKKPIEFRLVDINKLANERENIKPEIKRQTPSTVVEFKFIPKLSRNGKFTLQNTSKAAIKEIETQVAKPPSTDRPVNNNVPI